MDNPIKIINARASRITQDFKREAHGITDKDEYDVLLDSHLGWIVSEMMGHFSGRIHSLSTYVYGSERGIALSAFKEYSSKTLQKGLETFLFKSEHWRTGRSVGPYLSTCLSKLADSLKSDIDFVKKVSIPVCPACKTLGEKEFLVYEGKLLRCPTCTKASARLEAQEIKSSGEDFEHRLRKVFSTHSRKGHRCPECERFVPLSFTVGSERASCPYDTCSWFGVASELEPMAHPLAQSSGLTVSLNDPIQDRSVGGSKGGLQMLDMIDAVDVNPDIRIEQEEIYRKEYKIAKTVLETQRSRLDMQSNPKVVKKLFMYKAFEDLLEHDPAGMISYLSRGKSLGERPIQSLIFQRYVQLIENHLPLEVCGEDGVTEVYSLTDPNLGVFLGESEYQAHVRESGLVANNTHEIFVGAKCNGPCFIGYLCDVTDENGKSMMSEVEYYSFASIKMKPTVPENTLLTVKHFRIPPHYEMYSLVNLQRVRRKVVDSIYKRLNGETRPLKGAVLESNKIIPQISR